MLGDLTALALLQTKLLSGKPLTQVIYSSRSGLPRTSGQWREKSCVAGCCSQEGQAPPRGPQCGPPPGLRGQAVGAADSFTPGLPAQHLGTNEITRRTLPSQWFINKHTLKHESKNGKSIHFAGPEAITRSSPAQIHPNLFLCINTFIHVHTMLYFINKSHHVILFQTLSGIPFPGIVTNIYKLF